jgi:predicted alpha/beta hydrolase
MSERSAPETVHFAARDGFGLNFHHYQAHGTRQAEPVLVLHGAGVRSDIFLPPTEMTFVDALLGAGYDVWLLNWRASVDLPPNKWTLEDAAVNDHPAAVKTIRDRTGAKTLKAVIHC